MGRIQRRTRPRSIGAAFVHRMGAPRSRRHVEALRRRQQDARGARSASRAVGRQIIFRHRSRSGEWAAVVAQILVDRHRVSLFPERHARTCRGHPRLSDGTSASKAWMAGTSPAMTQQKWLNTETPRRSAAEPASGTDRHYLSGDIGISTPPVTCLIGPAALGITSKSKMSVGSHKVAQAFGMSTTPEICPCTGAVPRMA